MPCDEDGKPYVRVDWNIHHLRMLHNAVHFYREHRVEVFDKTKTELPEPTEAVQPYIGKYFSQDWVRRKVLRQTDEEILEQDAQIEKEIAAVSYTHLRAHETLR